MEPLPRYEPCRLLRKAGIDCVVWFEDAIFFYGVPTIGFDLHLLVSDVDEAAQVLIRSEWTEYDKGKARRHFLDEHPHIRRRRLDPPGGVDTGEAKTWPPPPPTGKPPGPSTVVLLPAQEWGYPPVKLGEHATEEFFPRLPALVDALITTLLETDDRGVCRHLSIQVAYIYDYCQSLKKRSFADHLIPENRQFHYDAVAGASVSTLPVIAHERRVRDELRRGNRELMDFSIIEADGGTA